MVDMNSKYFHRSPSTLWLKAVWLTSILALSACSLSQFQSVDMEPQKSQPAEQVPDKKPADSITEKKLAFFTMIKPLVEKENSLILADRKRLIELRQARWLTAGERKWLQALAGRYGVSVKGRLDEAAWQSLLARVDSVPVDLAVVQAANESAWGQSRFAREANNYFGQWCYEKGCGIVPAERAEGASHEVKRFASAQESVRAYLHNLNSSRAYAEFRRLRQATRQQGEAADAERLAMGLKSYSERGMAYVTTIQAMIRSNRKLIRMS